MLQVELGRYSCPKTPFNERLCKMCNMEVEDQQHFLLHYTSLRIPRPALWAKIFEHNPDFISYDSTAKLAYLLHPTELIFIIAKGIHKLYMHRFTLISLTDIFSYHTLFTLYLFYRCFVVAVVCCFLLLLLSCLPRLTVALYM